MADLEDEPVAVAAAGPEQEEEVAETSDETAAVAGDPSQHDERDDAYQEEAASEETELEPAMAAVEVAPRSSDSGRIRFAEDVLRRRPEEPESEAQKQRKRRPRYVETDEGLEEDPYAEYQEEYSEE